LIQIWVNRESKIQSFGKIRPDIDPIPIAKAIQAKAASMTDNDFHFAYADLFNSMRDFHTNYFMPAPHACYIAIQPLLFDFVESDDLLNNPNIIVQNFLGVIRDPEVLKISAPEELRKVGAGDRLVAINGKSFKQYYEENQFKFGGANVFAGYRSALQALTQIGGQSSRMPTGSTTTFELISQKTGQQYKVVIPWLAFGINGCLGEYKAYLANPNSQNLVGPKSNAEKREERRKRKGQDFSKPPVAIPGLFSTLTPFQLSETDQSIVSWGIFKPNAENLGVLRISGFVPDRDDAEGTVELIRRLLSNELADTKALILDIRDNGGGNGNLASSIPQFFKAGIKDNRVRALVTPVNQRIFNSVNFGDAVWANAYNSAKPGDTYTPLVEFSNEQSINKFGQVYFKPVGVYTNANCYSACDLIAAVIQDNEAGWIFGEDGQTGAGGANVVENNDFLAKIVPDDFSVMPLFDKFKNFRPNTRVGWRQLVRGGKYAGKLIEDAGIVSDSIVRFTANDYVTRNFDSAFVKMSQKLAEIAKEKNVQDLFFSSSPDLKFDAKSGDPIAFQLTASGVTKITLEDASGKLLASQEVSRSQTKQKIALKSLSALSDTPVGFYRLKMSAFDGEKRVVETFRFMRLIPAGAQKLAQEPKALTLNSEFAAIYNTGAADKAAGWNQKDNVIQVGDGVEYLNDVNTQFRTFFQAAPSVKLSLTASYKTEETFDFFRVGYIDQNGVNHLLNSSEDIPGVSGIGIIDQEFQFAPSGPFELFADFISDGGVVGQGVTITKFEISL
jgi:hypothetical protein